MLHPAPSRQTAVDFETSYLHDVLQLEDGETEEKLDEQLSEAARELGVEIEAQDSAKPLSTRTFSSEPPRRSESINSRASQSTGFTSNFSQLSREQRPTSGKRSSRASLSFRDYDNFLARGVRNGRASMSFSPPTTPSESTFSLPLYSPESSPKKPPRVIRGLSMLRLHRGDVVPSDSCPHCPQNMMSQRRAVHKLPCGHRLCTQALRNMIKSVTGNGVGALPSCCGIPIPGKLVEHVMTQEEQMVFLDKLEQWDEATSGAPSDSSTNFQGTTRRPGTGSRKTSNDSAVDCRDPGARKEAVRFHDSPEYQRLHGEQIELRGRFMEWLKKRKATLASTHERLRADMKTNHETSIEDLHERHTEAMAEAEDKQVKAEADMRESQMQERRDNATALKHMEAYCSGTYRTGEAHNRSVTEQDLTELEKTRRVRDTMDIKHANAINVLRGEQSRRMKLRAQRQDKEVQELRRAQRKEELELERSCTSEMHGLDDFVKEKKSKIGARWELEVTICQKEVEVETGVMMLCERPNMGWQIDEESRPLECVRS